MKVKWHKVGSIRIAEFHSPKDEWEEEQVKRRNRIIYKNTFCSLMSRYEMHYYRDIRTRELEKHLISTFSDRFPVPDFRPSLIDWAFSFLLWTWMKW